MILITQLIYLREGQERVFDEFESVAIPIIRKYNGQLLLRLRPNPGDFIENSIEKPYEIHLVEFKTQADFDDFKQDEERKTFLHLKEQAIKTSVIMGSNHLIPNDIRIIK